MSGHSKWANIKHRKEGADKRRSTVFTKLSKELSVSARIGGPEPNSNPRLRIAIARARSHNMPKDTIERAIKKGTGALGDSEYEEITYEIFAQEGVALIVESLTDKKSRTTPEMKSILNKYHANLAETNAVRRLFERRGSILIAKSALSEDELFDLVVQARRRGYRRAGRALGAQHFREQLYASLRSLRAERA